jgi:hypothetical protein
VGRPWGGRWLGLDQLLVKCALAHLAAVLDSLAQAGARGAVSCASNIFARSAEAATRGTARCAWHVPDHGPQADAQTVDCGNATLPHQKSTR